MSSCVWLDVQSSLLMQFEEASCNLPPFITIIISFIAHCDVIIFAPPCSNTPMIKRIFHWMKISGACFLATSHLLTAVIEPLLQADSGCKTECITCHPPPILSSLSVERDISYVVLMPYLEVCAKNHEVTVLSSILRLWLFLLQGLHQASKKKFMAISNKKNEPAEE